MKKCKVTSRRVHAQELSIHQRQDVGIRKLNESIRKWCPDSSPSENAPPQTPSANMEGADTVQTSDHLGKLPRLVNSREPWSVWMKDSKVEGKDDTNGKRK